VADSNYLLMASKNPQQNLQSPESSQQTKKANGENPSMFQFDVQETALANN